MNIELPIPIRNHNEVLKRLRGQGIALVNNLLPDKHLRVLSNYAHETFSSSSHNNRNGYIKDGDHKFICHTMLAPHAADAYTNPDLIRISDEYCGSQTHISNHRIYQNLEKRRVWTKPMHWHKDNKIDYIDRDGVHKTKVVENDKGLILILYLTDVRIGGTQFALDSHESFNSIESFNPKQISDFSVYTANNLSAGTGILYDYRTIHRAQPFFKRRMRRISLFSQMSPIYMPKGEPIVISTDLLYSLDERKRQFVNFTEGPSSAPNWPLDSDVARKRHSIEMASATIKSQNNTL